MVKKLFGIIITFVRCYSGFYSCIVKCCDKPLYSGIGLCVVQKFILIRITEYLCCHPCLFITQVELFSQRICYRRSYKLSYAFRRKRRIAQFIDSIFNTFHYSVRSIHQCAIKVKKHIFIFSHCYSSYKEGVRKIISISLRISAIFFLISAFTLSNLS